MSKYRIRLDGKVYEMEIELVEDKGPDQPQPSKFPPITYKNSDSIVRVINPEAQKQTRINNNTVFSPMPGTIIKVLATVGDLVEKDEPVMVLEAMKMENEIIAPFTGRLTAIFIQEGDTVQGAAPLFEIEE